MDVGNPNEQQSGEMFYPVDSRPTPLDRAITSGVSPSVEGLSSQIEAMISSSSASAVSESVGSGHPLTSVLPSLQQQIVNAGVLSDTFPLQLANQQGVINNGLITSVGNLLQLSVALPGNQQLVTMATSPNIFQLPLSPLAGQDVDNANRNISQSSANVVPSVPASSANKTTGNPPAAPPVTTDSSTLSCTSAATTVSLSQAVNTNITTSGSNPLQVSVKTNSSVNQTLLSNIVNSQAVQSLLRDNPGQPITIVRMPQTVQQVSQKLSFPLGPISNLNFKAQKRNGTPLSAPRGRRPRKVREPERPEDKSKFVEFQKSLQKTTRSGRVSKPPMYRVKETLQTPVNSDQGQQDKGESGKAAEENTSVGRSPLEATGHTTTNNLRGLPSARRGHRGYSRGRGRPRGRSGNHGNRESLMKIRQLLLRVSDEDFISLVSPKLCELLSPWDFMLMRAFRRKKTEPNRTVVPLIKRILDEFQELLFNMRKLSRQCLVTGRSSIQGQPAKLDVPAALYGALGMRGTFYIKELPKELLTSRIISFTSDDIIDESADNLSAETTTLLTETTDDGILGVESIFQENALKGDITAKRIPATSGPSASTPVQVDPSIEATGMIVNVEEIETSDMHTGSDVNLNQIQVQEPVSETTTERGIAKENLIQALPDGAPLSGGGTIAVDGPIHNNGPSSRILTEGQILHQVETVHGGETLPSAQTVYGSNSQTLQQDISMSITQTSHEDESSPDSQTIHGAESISNAQALQGRGSLPISAETMHDGGRLSETEENLPDTSLALQEAEADVVYEEPMEASSGEIDGMVPGPLQPTTSPMVPVGSTIMQMADGNFLVQKPDGTAMQIHAPEGMTIETIQALLTVETEVSDQPVQAEHAVDDQDYLAVNEVTG